jgi:hypothetical protein
MKRDSVVAWVLAIAVTVYVVSRNRDSTEPREMASPGTEVVSVVAPASAPPTPQSPPAPAGAQQAQLSDEERAAAIKHAMTKAMADSRDAFVAGLVAQGLARADSEQIAQRMIEGLADCLFEAALEEYEAHGVGVRDFMDLAEILWNQPVELSANPNLVASVAEPCTTNVSQQAGIPLPAGAESPGRDIAARFSAGLESPIWAAEMEARIRDHIASYPDLTLSRLLVKCREDGCNVMMVGRAVPFFELEFDHFAEQNGFTQVTPGGNRDRRFVWLQR